MIEPALLIVPAEQPVGVEERAMPIFALMLPPLVIVMLPPLLCRAWAVGNEIIWFDGEHDASAGADNASRVTSEAPASNAAYESRRPPGGAKMPEISLKSPIMSDR